MDNLSYDELNNLEKSHWWFQARKKILTKLTEKYYKYQPEAKVLDIGCGTGATLEQLKGLGEVWGIEKDKLAVDYCRQKLPKANITQGIFPEEVPAEKFDLVTILDVLEHIADDEKALQKASEILKPAGVLIVTVPAYKFIWSSHDQVNQHYRRYTLIELKQKLKKTGLRIKKISYFNTILFLPIVIGKVAKRIFGSSKPTSHLKDGLPPVFLNQILEMIFSLEKDLLPFFNLPFGISIIAIAKKQ